MTAIMTGVGSSLPAGVVTNDAFAGLGLTDAWISQRTGISSRHRLSHDERLTDIAAKASADALADAGVSPQDIDFVVVATTTPDDISPGIAPELANLIGAHGVGAIDLSGACTGFLYGLDYAVAKIEHGTADRILVVGADAMSRITNFSDRDTAPLFGDGAGAVVLESTNVECEECSAYFSFGSAGEYAQNLVVRRDDPVVTMHGAEVYMHAVDAMSSELTLVLGATGLEQKDVDLLLCHQANQRILDAVTRRLGWDPSKVASVLEKFGNTSSASIPLALGESVRQGAVRAGGRIAFAAFGAGFTWGAGVARWKACPHGRGAPSRIPLDAEVGA